MGERKDFHLELTSDPEHLRGVREAIREWIEQEPWDEHAVADIVLAVDEALTNVIRHGYGGKPGERIVIDMSRISDPERGEGVEISIRDFGTQVPLESIAGRDLDDLRPGGLGVHIIQSVMDGARYRHMSDGGTELRMKKFRPEDPAPDGEAEPAS